MVTAKIIKHRAYIYYNSTFLFDVPEECVGKAIQTLTEFFAM